MVSCQLLRALWRMSSHCCHMLHKALAVASSSRESSRLCASACVLSRRFSASFCRSRCWALGLSMDGEREISRLTTDCEEEGSVDMARRAGCPSALPLWLRRFLLRRRLGLLVGSGEEGSPLMLSVLSAISAGISGQGRMSSPNTSASRFSAAFSTLQLLWWYLCIRCMCRFLDICFLSLALLSFPFPLRLSFFSLRSLELCRLVP
mmetsp:Transcript_32735/g.92850  ORF Transcript_32735/g.92850 Transcript_32735/m.92850 type:complete len:206 (-) Transcript_32735:721-1338(-)